MVNLKWKGKNEIKNLPLESNQIKPFHILDFYPSTGIEPNENVKWQNQLIWGENKVVMSSLLKNFEDKITLIYIDPPFATGGDFNLKIQIGEDGNCINEIAYKDKWKE
jgi:adenine-specific DNA-methyltransferase